MKFPSTHTHTPLPRRYFIWSVERVLERVAASMLSTQYIIEGTTIVCDARGWDQQNVSERGGAWLLLL